MSGIAQPKHSPLESEHQALGARLIEFGGWLMPVQYTSILAEHQAVRTAAGLFDLSHMGELEVSGPRCEEALQALVVSDVSRLAPGQAQYSLLCRPDGGILDDLVIYRRRNGFLLVVNAANTDKDAAWLHEHLGPGVQLADRTEETGLIAVQGPRSEAILQLLTPADLGRLPFYHFVEAPVAGVPSLIARTGYTGEDGFEIYGPADRAGSVWAALREAGAAYGLQPAGLGARDTLRLEVRYPLYGHELTEEVSPLEAGLGWTIAWDKGPFVGRDALAAQKAHGVPRRVIGFWMEVRGIPRQGYAVWHGDRPVGRVTSGGFGPSVGKDIGMALVDRTSSAPGTSLAVEIRGKRLPARVVKGRFVQPRTKSGSAAAERASRPAD